MGTLLIEQPWRQEEEDNIQINSLTSNIPFTLKPLSHTPQHSPWQRKLNILVPEKMLFLVNVSVRVTFTSFLHNNHVSVSSVSLEWSAALSPPQRRVDCLHTRLVVGGQNCPMSSVSLELSYQNKHATGLSRTRPARGWLEMTIVFTSGDWTIRHNYSRERDKCGGESCDWWPERNCRQLFISFYAPHYWQ